MTFKALHRNNFVPETFNIMQYFETELFFSEDSAQEKNREAHFPNAEPGAAGRKKHNDLPAEVLGIKVRIGNRPLVYKLKANNSTADKNHAAVFLQDATKDYYLVVHAIGAVRMQGKARVGELQYFAEAIEPVQLKTIDLVPGTAFKEVLKAGANLEVALSITGEALLNIPVELLENLVPRLINMGGDMQLHLSSSANFVGKFTLSLQLPVIQATGIASNTCSWILNPDENKTPLLGDQLLVQSIMVPKDTSAVTYKIQGLVKADRGLFWKQRQQKTPEYTVQVKLD